MWKTLIGKCIYRSEKINVYQNFLYRWLMFSNNAYQSVLNKKNPEIPGLSYLTHLTFAVQLIPKDCCILGLGGAGAAHLLSKQLQNYTMIAIENDPEIIYIAKKYFLIENITNLVVIEQDASVFVIQHQQQYFHILVDLFVNDVFPAECNNLEFFIHCKERLFPDGILAVNIAREKDKWNVFKKIRQVFNQKTILLPVADSSNLIILGYNGESLSALLELFKDNWRLRKLTWDQKWGCIAYL